MMAPRKSQEGFTLVEILVVTSITVFITGALVANFSRTRVDLNQTALLLMDAIREPQALTLAGSTVAGAYRCGYGIHFLPNGYVIYAGPVTPPADCSTAGSRLFAAGTKIREALFANTVLEIAPLPPDIYFEPPNPTTYINGVNTPSTQTTIIVRRKGANCSAQKSPDCRKINVTTSGLIQSQ